MLVNLSMVVEERSHHILSHDGKPLAVFGIGDDFQTALLLAFMIVVVKPTFITSNDGTRVDHAVLLPNAEAPDSFTRISFCSGISSFVTDVSHVRVILKNDECTTVANVQYLCSGFHFFQRSS